MKTTLLSLALCAAGATAAVVPSVTPAEWSPVDFAADLHRRLAAAAAPDANLVCSPYGAASCAALVGVGARGDTAVGIAAALRLGTADAGRVAATFRDARAALDGAADERVGLTLSDSLWLAPAFRPEAPFLDLVRDAFAADARTITMDAAGRKAVNAFVKEKTGGLIPELLAPPDPNPATRLLALDTIHLKAKWRMPFDRGDTFDASFHAPGGDRDVPFLHSTRKATILDAPECAALRLPYGSGAMEMLVILPAPSHTVAEVEALLSRDYLDRLAAKPWKGEAAIALPKFSFENKASLKEPLTAMGMGKAFDPAADFSGISETDGLYLGDILQKAVVRVDEEGTEAAVATVAMMLATALPPEEAPPPPRPFVADRPFLFLVREVRTGLPLFLGRVCTPDAK